ncbi:hypothetical protein P7K49_015268, partial [Saguinus oedipus]
SAHRYGKLSLFTATPSHMAMPCRSCARDPPKALPPRLAAGGLRACHKGVWSLQSLCLVQLRLVWIRSNPPGTSRTH